MKPKFNIPVRRDGVQREFPADTLVIPVPTSLVKSDFEVELAKPRSVHIPESPRYTILRYPWSLNDEAEAYPWFTIRAVRLSRITPKHNCLIHVEGPKLCFLHGSWHAIRTQDERLVEGPCGSYLYTTDTRVAFTTETRVPTCPECLAAKWECFEVGDYSHPSQVRKTVDKEAVERRFRARIPTLFERILMEDEEDLEDLGFEQLSDQAPYEDLEEPQGREAKLQSRVDRAKRIRDAKAKLKGYR